MDAFRLLYMSAFNAIDMNRQTTKHDCVEPVSFQCWTSVAAGGQHQNNIGLPPRCYLEAI